MNHMRDRLFLLPPGFEGRGRREYCPECAEIWGLLSYFPALKESLSISYQPIERPRSDMIDLLGAEHQNCPTLVLYQNSPSYEACGIKRENGQRFIDNARDIGLYYASRFGLPLPRGHKRD